MCAAEFCRHVAVPRLEIPLRCRRLDALSPRCAACRGGRSRLHWPVAPPGRDGGSTVMAAIPRCIQCVTRESGDELAARTKLGPRLRYDARACSAASAHRSLEFGGCGVRTVLPLGVGLVFPAIQPLMRVWHALGPSATGAVYGHRCCMLLLLLLRRVLLRRGYGCSACARSGRSCTAHVFCGVQAPRLPRLGSAQGQHRRARRIPASPRPRRLEL